MDGWKHGVNFVCSDKSTLFCFVCLQHYLVRAGLFIYNQLTPLRDVCNVVRDPAGHKEKQRTDYINNQGIVEISRKKGR